jgi:hypothetical protein
MVTTAWDTVRDMVVKLFRHNNRLKADIERQLEVDAQSLARAAQRKDDVNAARRELIPRWTRELDQLLRERPEAEPELRQLIGHMGGEQRRFVQENTSRENSVLIANMFGEQHVYGFGKEPGTRSDPLSSNGPQ